MSKMEQSIENLPIRVKCCDVDTYLTYKIVLFNI